MSRGRIAARAGSVFTLALSGLIGIYERELTLALWITLVISGLVALWAWLSPTFVAGASLRRWLGLLVSGSQHVGLGSIQPEGPRRKTNGEVREELVRLIAHSKGNLERRSFGGLGLMTGRQKEEVYDWEKQAIGALTHLKDQSFKARLELLNPSDYPLPEGMSVRRYGDDASNNRHFDVLRRLYAKRRLLETIYEELGVASHFEGR